MIVAVHKQVDMMVNKAKMAIDEAKEQINKVNRLEQGDLGEFTEAQMALEEISEELDALYRSATREQKDRLQRAMQQIRQTMNEMILR